MKTSQLRCTRALKLLTTLSSAAILAFLTFGAASGAASQSQSHATRPTTRRFLAVASRAVPRPLTVASQRSRRADRNLVAKAKALRKCLAAPPASPRTRSSGISPWPGCAGRARKLP